MEAARRACGGHGYSLLSGLPTLFTHYVQNVTWEGDNNVMLLQVTPAASLLHPACLMQLVAESVIMPEHWPVVRLMPRSWWLHQALYPGR